MGEKKLGLTEEKCCHLLVIWYINVYFLAVIVYFESQKRNCLFQGLGTDEETLIEILCSRSSDEMKDIKSAYTESK